MTNESAAQRLAAAIGVMRFGPGWLTTRNKPAVLMDTNAEDVANFLAADPTIARDMDLGAALNSDKAEALARRFHEAYERLAPSFGYVTRAESAVPWEDVPEPNRSLMVAVARAILTALREGLAEDE